MAHYPRPPHSSPPSQTQHYDPSPDTSLSVSDRSVRSMHSAPSLSSRASSSVVSNPSTNLNVHLIPLPNSHLHIHSGDDSIEYSDDGSHKPVDSKSGDDEGEDTVQVYSFQVLPPNITITPSQGRLAVERVDSEQTVLPPNDNLETQQINDHEGYVDDDESDSGVTDELRRTLFYRPSTDPVTVAQSQTQSHPDSELNAILSAGATSSTNLLSNTDPNPPIRPPRPPSLNLSDTDEPQPNPKSIDIVRPGPGHSRMSSRERLGAIFGAKGNRNSLGGAQRSSWGPAPRSSLGAVPRPSIGGGARPSMGGHSGGVLPLSIKGKAPAPFPVDERVVEVHQVEAGGSGLQRVRTISDPLEEMDRSVWEDDTEELGTAWGMVKKWLGEESKASGSNTNSLPSKKPKQNRHGVKSLSLASTISAFRTPPTSPGIRERDSRRYSSPLLRSSTPLGLHDALHDTSALGFQDTSSSPVLHDSFGLSAHDNSGPALRESSVLGLHESSILGSGSNSGHDWANASTSRASFQTANISFQTETETETGTDFRTADASTNQSFHSLNPSQSFQSLTASQPSFHSLDPTASQPSLSVSRRSFQSRRLGVGHRASVGSSLSSLAEPPESPTMTPGRIRSGTVSSSDQERPRSQLLVVPERESKPLFAEPVPQKVVKEEDETVNQGLPSPPSSPSPIPRVPRTTGRSLHNPTYPSLHKRLGSLVQHSTPKHAPPSPLSPLWSPPQASGSSPAGTSRRDQTPGTSRREQSPASARWSQAPASPQWSPLYPSSPGALGMESDVRPISGITESSYYGRGSGAGTVGRPDSGGTWAGSQRGLLVPPQAKTVRLVDPPERDRRTRDKEGLPSPPPSASKVGTIFRTTSSVYSGGPGPRIRRRVEYEAGMSPGKWFALGFVLGPWCWLIGGWMLDGRNRVIGVIGDAEKGERMEGEQWVRRCRIASVVSGVVVLVVAIVAVVYAVLGAR